MKYENVFGVWRQVDQEGEYYFIEQYSVHEYREQYADGLVALCQTWESAKAALRLLENQNGK